MRNLAIFGLLFLCSCNKYVAFCDGPGGQTVVVEGQSHGLLAPNYVRNTEGTLIIPEQRCVFVKQEETK